MKITNFDKEICRTLSKSVEDSLQKLSQDLGVEIKYKSGTFSPTNFSMKIEASVIKNGTALSRETERFNLFCKNYNLEPSDLNKTFTHEDGNVFKIIGLTPRRCEYPILAINLKNGETYRLPARTVQRGLGKPIGNPLEKW